MALSAQRIAYYPYATPDELDLAGLGAARLPPAQIEAYARQVALNTANATWAVDTNTVGIFTKITNCADQDAVAKRATTGMVGRPKTVYGSLAEARKLKKLVCVKPSTGITAITKGMSSTTKLLIGGAAVVAVLGVGAVVILKRS